MGEGGRGWGGYGEGGGEGSQNVPKLVGALDFVISEDFYDSS